VGRASIPSSPSILSAVSILCGVGSGPEARLRLRLKAISWVSVRFWVRWYLHSIQCLHESTHARFFYPMALNGLQTSPYSGLFLRVLRCLGRSGGALFDERLIAKFAPATSYMVRISRDCLRLAAGCACENDGLHDDSDTMPVSMSSMFVVFGVAFGSIPAAHVLVRVLMGHGTGSWHRRVGCERPVTGCRWSGSFGRVCF
jgi:hypothetical protein